MLADSRATQYVRNFAGQWLGFRALDTHEVDAYDVPRLERRPSTRDER